MTKSPNRVIGLIFGVIYIVIGLVGFTATTGVGFFATNGGLLLGLFEVNLAHNLAHLAIGVVLFIAALVGPRISALANAAVGAFYLVLGIAGLFLVDSQFNFLALNVADNVLHFASAAVLLAVGLGALKPAPKAA
ncbi:MAG: DUF4383 domain-containing protein [Actinomycetota bacterium]|nr:DUF4383 domain-containing protein [Actinomycetota bacterium]